MSSRLPANHTRWRKCQPPDLRGSIERADTHHRHSPTACLFTSLHRIMASTPDTSFSSEHGTCWRVSKRRHDAPARPTELPSPQRSDTDLESERAQETHHNALDDAYRAIWKSFCGLPAQEDPTFSLDQQAYDELHEKLAAHDGLLAHFEKGIRKDWNARTRRLTLRLMAPSCVHEVFQEHVKSALRDELDRIAHENAALRPFRRNIIQAGQAQVQKKRRHQAGAPIFEQSPDAQFRYKGARQPPFILEVAYSQDQKDLLRKVTEIFMAMPGKVGTVLAFDIGYEPRAGRKDRSHTASVSLWTSQQSDETFEVARVLNAEVFCCDGQAKPGTLTLDFDMFVPLSERAKLPQDDTRAKLQLSFNHLAQFVLEAEQAQLAVDASVSPPPSPTLRPPAKRIRFLEANGDVTMEAKLPDAKRQRATSDQAPPSSRTRSRTRSLSQPRRSGRVRSRSRAPEE